MAQVEIYKLRKTAPPNVRDYSVFDYMRHGKSPDPAHYIKEWAGRMHGALPLTIPGRLMLQTPENYHGGDIKNGDIAVVDGKPFFFDKLEGSKFVELDSFDSGSVRTARHFPYGWFVDIKGAEPLSDIQAFMCSDIGIPCGHLGEQSAGGVYNDKRPFLPSTASGEQSYFLHPQFLQGEEAREFIGLLTDLSGTDRWHNIFDYLHERAPLTVQDLQDAREKFAPELFLPAELQPLHKLIPADADKVELDYLAAKIAGMSEKQQMIFDAVVEAGWYTYNIAEIINLTENLDCFDLEPAATNESLYGAFRLENDYDICEMAIRRLEKSDDPADRFLAKHIALLTRCAEEEAYGYHAMKEDGGAFTKHGYITQGKEIAVIYRGVQDIPAEYGVQQPATPEQTTPPQAMPEQPLPIMVYNTDLSALLMGMHAVGGEYMRDAAYNVKALASKGDDFFIRTHPGMLIVTPADSVFRRDTDEHQSWMMLSASPDIRAFILSVTDRADGKITGNLFEADLYSIQDNIRENSFFFTHLDAEMKDGTSRRFTLEEWDAMDRADRAQLKSWKKHYDPADEARLAAYFSALRWAAEENRQIVAPDAFLSQLNAAYMTLAANPQPDMLRIAPEAAQEMLARDAVHVYRLMPGDMGPLSPIDAIKIPAYQYCREFAVKPQDLAGIEKWARRASGDILRQAERGERDKTKNKAEAL
jgi:hypothetical protein